MVVFPSMLAFSDFLLLVVKHKCILACVFASDPIFSLEVIQLP